MEIKKVTLFGSGQLGTRLGFKIAFHGFDITICDISNGELEQAKTKFREIGDSYTRNSEAKPEDVQAALARIAYTTEMEAAAGNADLIIESIPEDESLKKEFYAQLGKTAPKNAIFATTSSSLPPYELSEESGHKDRFLNFHFGKEIRGSVEIVAPSKVNSEVIETVAAFFYELDMEVKEKS